MKKHFQFDEVIQVARGVCEQIEKFDVRKPSSLLSSLIKLLNCTNDLNKYPFQVESKDLCIPSIDTMSLKHIPKDIVFHEVFDPLDAASMCEVSLKDSLKDIYEALKGGLLVLDQEPEKEMAVLWEWKNDFQFHWGSHLVDVVRFLTLCKDVRKG